MAKARTLVGLDVHAAKVVAAILDSETGELRFQRLGGRERAGGEPLRLACRAGEGELMRPARPATGSPGRSRPRASSAWSRRRERSPAARLRG